MSVHVYIVFVYIVVAYFLDNSSGNRKLIHCLLLMSVIRENFIVLIDKRFSFHRYCPYLMLVPVSVAVSVTGRLLKSFYLCV